MGMNIVVISPHTHRAGNTTVASLLCSALASRGRKVCLTHAKTKSDSIYGYFNIKEAEDKTTNPHRLVKMLREGAIKPEDADDYCKVVNKNFSLFSANSEKFAEEDMLFALDFITQYFPHDFVVYDFDSDNFYGDCEKIILEKADVVLLVIEPNKIELNKFRDKKNEILTVIGKKPIITCVNKYSNAIDLLKEISSYMGIKTPNNWVTLRYNPYIQWATNNGKMKFIMERIESRDIRVIELEKDMKEIANAIMRVKIAKRQAIIKAQISGREDINNGEE